MFQQLMHRAEQANRNFFSVLGLRHSFRRILTTLLIVASVPLADASAGTFRNFGILCTPGVMRACSSVQAWNQRDLTTGEYYLYVRLGNVQGLPHFTDLRPSGLQNWHIDNLAIRDCVFMPFLGDCTTSQSLAERIEGFSGPGTDFITRLNGDRATVGYSGTGDSGATIWGCDGPAPGDNGWSPLVIGCGSTYTYRIHMGFGAGLELTDQSALSFDFDGRADDGSIWFAACSQSTDPPSWSEGECLPATVPEPVTIVMLATGLVGIGGARIRRRKHGNPA